MVVAFIVKTIAVTAYEVNSLMCVKFYEEIIQYTLKCISLFIAFATTLSPKNCASVIL